MCIFVIVCVYAHTKPHELLGHLCLICVPLKTLFFVVDMRTPTNTCERVRTRTLAYARAFFTSVVCMCRSEMIFMYCFMCHVGAFVWLWWLVQSGPKTKKWSQACFTCFAIVNTCVLIHSSVTLTKENQCISDPTTASSLGDVFCDLAAIPNQLWVRPPCCYKMHFSYRAGSGHVSPNHGFFIGCCFLWSVNHLKPVVTLITLLLQD